MDLTRKSRKRARSPSTTDQSAEKIQKISGTKYQTAIQVFIKLPTGKTIQFDVDPTSHSVLDLKNRICQDQHFWEPTQLILSSAGLILEDEKMFQEYNIQQDSTVFVCAKNPSKDVLFFDECNYCHYQAIEPVGLPCGHSCCKSCVPSGAASCPITGCKADFPVARDALPSNWLAAKFFEEKPEEVVKVKMCQLCAESGIQTKACHWCQTCSTTAGLGLLCDPCNTSEHSTRTSSSHVRLPVEKESQHSVCSKHRTLEDSFCLDDNRFICRFCHDKDHKLHDVKLVSDYAAIIRENLKTSVISLLDHDTFKSPEAALQHAKEKKQKELDRLEKRISFLKDEIELTDRRITQVHENATKAGPTSQVLNRLIEDLPNRDLCDRKKFGTMLLRVDQTLECLGAKESPITSKYKQKARILTGKRDRPFGIAVLNSGHILLTDLDKIGVFEANGVHLRSIIGFSQPTAVVEHGKLIIIADNGHRKIQVLSNTGLTRIKNIGYTEEGEYVFDPFDLAVGIDGNLIVVDYSNQKIKFFALEADEDEDLVGNWEYLPTVAGKHVCPRGICVDPKGNIVISDDAERVQIFSPLGESLRVFAPLGEGLTMGLGRMTTDLSGNIIIIDRINHRLKIFSIDGIFLNEIQEPQGITPHCVTVDKNGKIFVGHRHEIRVFEACRFLAAPEENEQSDYSDDSQ